MAWDVERLYENGEKSLPLLVYSGQCVRWGQGTDHLTGGEVVGLFVKDEKTRRMIEDKDPIILEMFIAALDEVDKISEAYRRTEEEIRALQHIDGNQS